MTCIVALKTQLGPNTCIVMGGDSAGVAGLDVSIRKDPKVFKKGEFLIGYTTSFRMGQIIRFNLSLPDIQQGMDPYEYMVTCFVERLRASLKEGGFIEVSNSVEKGGHFIVGFRDRLFMVGSDFQVAENDEDFAAAGCGADYAYGALEVLHTSSQLSTEDKLVRALEVAAKFSGGVRGPFVMVSNRPELSVPAARVRPPIRLSLGRFRHLEPRMRVRAVCTTCWPKARPRAVLRQPTAAAL